MIPAWLPVMAFGRGISRGMLAAARRRQDVRQRQQEQEQAWARMQAGFGAAGERQRAGFEQALGLEAIREAGRGRRQRAGFAEARRPRPLTPLQQLQFEREQALKAEEFIRAPAERELLGARVGATRALEAQRLAGAAPEAAPRMVTLPELGVPEQFVPQRFAGEQLPLPEAARIAPGLRAQAGAAATAQRAERTDAHAVLRETPRWAIRALEVQVKGETDPARKQELQMELDYLRALRQEALRALRGQAVGGTVSGRTLEPFE